MKSCLYQGKVSHVRSAVRKYRFEHLIPWWMLDLDEVDEIQSKCFGFRRNGFSLFSFRDFDHIYLGQKSAKENVIAWMREQGVTDEITSVRLLTQLRTLGYVFNPVSFYFVNSNEKKWVVIEIGNTFWEQKPTLLGPFTGEEIVQDINKLFYISPFLSLENRMRLKISWPSETLRIHIDDRSPSGATELTAIFVGKRHEIGQFTFLKMALRYPALCFLITYSIHWHALKLWLMGIPYFKKNDQLDKQQGVFQWKSRKFVKTS